MLWLVGIVDLGIGSAMITVIARNVALREFKSARQSIGVALVVMLMLALCLATFGCLAVSALVSPDHRLAYLIAVLGLSLNLPLSLANNLWWGLQKGPVAAFWDAVQITCLIGLTVCAAARPTSLAIFVSIVFVAGVAGNFGSTLHAFVFNPLLRPDWMKPASEVVRLIHVSAPYFITALFLALTYQLDNALTLTWSGSQSAARMAVSSRVCVTLTILIWAMLQPLWPEFSRNAADNDKGALLHGLRQGLLLSLGISLIGAVCLYLFGRRMLLAWLHTDLGIDDARFFAMGVWIVIMGTMRVPALFMNSVSLTRFQSIATGGTAVITLLLKYFLARRFEDLGVLWSTPLVWSALLGPLFYWRIRRWFGHATQATGDTPGRGEPLQR